MGRSSSRHKREIQGYDSAGEQAGDHDEYNDYTESGVEPSTTGSTEPTGGSTGSGSSTSGETKDDC